MRDSPEQDYSELLPEMGRLVLFWNDLDWAIRNIIYVLTMRDLVSVLILTADMNTTAALSALRALATERDALEIHTAKHPETVKMVGRKEQQPILENIQHFIDYVDRLREYRNFYVHGICTPTTEGFIARTATARGRLSFFEQRITPADLKKLTAEIRKCIRYADNICTAFSAAQTYLSSPNPSVLPPTWPEKPQLPDKLVKPRLVLLGAKAQPPASQE